MPKPFPNDLAIHSVTAMYLHEEEVSDVRKVMIK